MDALDRQIEAYEGMREFLERAYRGKWVVIHNEELAGAYDSFAAAADDAVQRFQRGPYLIREVGAVTTAVLPASVQFRPQLEG